MRLAHLGPGALTLAALVALSTRAHAGVDVGVIVTGDGSIQPQLAAQIEGWLTQHGRTLLPSPLPPDAITALVDCFATEDQTCARGVVEKRARPSTMVYARIDAKNNTSSGARDVTLTAYLFEKGHDTVAERKTCERCTDQALRSTADDVMAKLLGAGAVGHVKLTSSPRGAKIAVDGKALGVTPLDWDLAPGGHTITLSKPGFVTTSRNIVVQSDKTTSEPFELAIATTTTPGGTSRLLPVSAVAVGGALVITGAVLIAIHQDKTKENPPTVHNTKSLGIGLGIGGVAVAATGLYFLLRGDSAPSSAPVAVWTADSAYVGWAGRF